MMNRNVHAPDVPSHRHSATPEGRPQSRPATEEEISRATRAWQVKLMLEEMRDVGLRPPRGLTTALDLFVDGRATVPAVQAYLDQQLSAPVLSLSLEVRHA